MELQGGEVGLEKTYKKNNPIKVSLKLLFLDMMKQHRGLRNFILDLFLKQSLTLQNVVEAIKKI